MTKTLKAQFLIAIFLLLYSGSYAQKTRVSNEQFNEEYLEHLVKVRVDDVRAKHACKALVNDSILYVASKHHAGYMQRKRRMSHFENDIDSMKTPQLRVDHFGGENYAVGENVLMTDYDVDLTGKKGKKFDGRYYESLADAIVNGWVNSPGHFKNIITPEYQITGVTVAIDKEKKRLYACQKFARVPYQYTFEESKTLFSYSEYTPPAPVTNFAGIPNKLIDQKYDWKLRHDKLEACEDCPAETESLPFVSLRLERNSFILRIENSEFVQDVIHDKFDGFAVEIVEFNDFVCDNPDYYLKPSRRNGQSRLNGRILEPVYRKDLMKGFKKRKRRKDVRFLSYIFKADSVPFFKRFSRFKMRRFSSEYFEIKLGRVPKNLNGLWAHNLVYIQNRQLCRVDYFTQYCGEVISDSVETPLLVPGIDTSYHFEVETRPFTFTVPFEKNASEFDQEKILQFLAPLKDVTYTVDSIHIQAYASVEGDSLSNLALQKKRAQNIVDIIRDHRGSSIPQKIATSTDWDHFYEIVKSSRKWKHLYDKSHQELIATIDANLAKELEPILEKERRADIQMYCTINLTDENLHYYIRREYDRFCDSLKIQNKSEEYRKHFLAKVEHLYAFTYSKTREGIITPEFLAGLEMPRYYSALSLGLMEKLTLFGYTYQEAFKRNMDWMETHRLHRENLVNGYIDRIRPETIYIDAKIRTDALKNRRLYVMEEAQKILSNLERLDGIYHQFEAAEEAIDKVNFNLNMILLNRVFAEAPAANSTDASKSLTQIEGYYKKYGLMNDSIAFRLGKTYVEFNDIEGALRVMAPYMTSEVVLDYALPLSFDHPSRAYTLPYYAVLLQMSEQLPRKTWCNLFLDECRIPFQAFDHEELRNKFCSMCWEENDFLQRLINGQIQNE